MAWAKFNDQMRSHPKHLRMRTEPMAKLLFYEVIVACNEALTNGHVPDYLLDRWAYDCNITTARQLKACTDVLVRLERWHDHETIQGCEECMEESGGSVEPGSFYVHGYLENQPSAEEVKDPLERKRWRRKKALHRDTELCTAIRQRDHDLCRYCGCEVNFKARSGDTSGTYDHINPNDFGSNQPGDKDGGNALHKIAVACRRCNAIKKNRTPDEAHMPLLEEPKAYDTSTGEVLAVSGPVLAAGQEPARKPDPIPGPGQDSRAHARETGPGRDGSGTGQEPAGAGQGGGGPGRTGTGRTRGGAASGRRGPGKAGGGPSRDGPGRRQLPPPTSSTADPSDATTSPATDPRSTPDG